jgi:hypothetical protein
MVQRSNTQRFTILAQDPAVRVKGALALEQIDIPLEMLADGPTGYRVKVVDFDASTNLYYSPHHYQQIHDGNIEDPFALPKGLSAAKRKKFDQELLENPNFHSQNVYAIVMRTLARFEYALGRRVAWGFGGHQLHVVPHAFNEANAYYSESDRALMFGYFQGKKGKFVFTSLSHDIVAHEATHAILDGLRTRYTDPSGPDQAGFHEGFADVIALLSIFSLKSIVELALTLGEMPIKKNGVRLVKKSSLQPEALSQSILFGLAKEFGQQLEGFRANALRRSISLKPSTKHLKSPEFEEPHSRGEILAAAMLRSFLELWLARVQQLGTFGRDLYNLDAVVGEGAKVADHLLTIAIRALDYCPSVDLEFGDYLAALLTVDSEVAPDDSRFSYRDVIFKTFKSYGITPPDGKTDERGCWLPFGYNNDVHYHKTNFESMLRDPEEVFRFVWENRDVLNVDSRGYTQVISVRPSVRQGPDGFILRETICEYIQVAEMFGSEVTSVLNIARPVGMSTRQRVTAYGGAVLVFDQYGRIKYHIERALDDSDRQAKRLKYLWDNGHLDRYDDQRNRFADLHRARAMAESNDTENGRK